MHWNWLPVKAPQNSFCSHKMDGKFLLKKRLYFAWKVYLMLGGNHFPDPVMEVLLSTNGWVYKGKVHISGWTKDCASYYGQYRTILNSSICFKRVEFRTMPPSMQRRPKPNGKRGWLVWVSISLKVRSWIFPPFLDYFSYVSCALGRTRIIQTPPQVIPRCWSGGNNNQQGC